MSSVKLRFSEVVGVKKKKCKTCLTLIYTIPCEVNKAIVPYFSKFGKSKFDLNTVTLLQIESDDGYTIRSKLKRTAISLSIPKRLEKYDLDKKTRKLEFEKCLTKWLEDSLKIKVV